MSLPELVQAIIISFSAVFLMEMGDKTQVTAFTLSIKYRSSTRVFLGSLIGLTMVTAIGVVIGQIMKNTIDEELLKPVIGVFFILGGLFLLIKTARENNDEAIRICPVSMDLCDKPREDCDLMDECSLYLKEVIQKGAIVRSMLFMFLAELGDKTMFMGTGLSTQLDAIGVFLGATIALAVVNGIGIIAGGKIAKIIPKNKLEIVSGFLFIIIGIAVLFL